MVLHQFPLAILCFLRVSVLLAAQRFPSHAGVPRFTCTPLVLRRVQVALLILIRFLCSLRSPLLVSQSISVERAESARML